MLKLIILIKLRKEQFKIGKKEREAARRAQALQKRYNEQKQQEILNKLHQLSNQQENKQEVINKVKSSVNQTLNQKQILQNAQIKQQNKIELTQQEKDLLNKHQQKIQELEKKRKQDEFNMKKFQEIQQEYLQELQNQQNHEEKQEQEEYNYQPQTINNSITESSEEFIYQDLIENKLNYNLLTQQKPSQQYFVDFSLPISQIQEEIRYNLQKSDTILIQTPTGSGKSTQITQILLNLGYQKIFMTQPRKVAVYNVFERITNLVDESQIKTFGYAVRGQNINFSQSQVKIATEGVLLQILQNKEEIDTYDCIILDEIHELSCNMELLLSFLVQIQEKRRKLFQSEIQEKLENFKVLGMNEEIKREELINKPLKLVFMSATVSTEKLFQNKNLFKFQIPLLSLKSKLYPIEIHYQQEEVRDVVTKAQEICIKILKSSKNGNILIFLQGKQQIQQFITQINKIIYQNQEQEGKNMIEDEDMEEEYEYEIQPQTFKEIYEISQFKDKIKILPLHGALSFEQQQDIFNEKYKDKRLIIVATNIAESSVTLPDIAYVIDSCLVKQKQYSNDIVTYKTIYTSLNSIQQRTGRCGRLGPGTCYRLVTAGQISNFEQDLEAEIKNTDLKDICIQLIRIGVRKPQNFKFISQISQEQIYQALYQLQLFNVIKFDQDEVQLTEFGNKTLQYSIPIRLACILAFLPQNPLSYVFTSIQGIQGIYTQNNEQKNIDFIQKIENFIELFNIQNIQECKQLCEQKNINFTKFKEARIIFDQNIKKNNFQIKKIQMNDNDLIQLKSAICRWYIDHLCQRQIDGSYLLFKDVNLRTLNKKIKEDIILSNAKLRIDDQQQNYLVYSELKGNYDEQNNKGSLYIGEYMFVDIDDIRPHVYNLIQICKLQQYNNARFQGDSQIIINCSYIFKSENFQFIIDNCELLIDKTNKYWYNWVSILILSQLEGLKYETKKIIANFDIQNQNQNFKKFIQFIAQYKINNFEQWNSIRKVMKQRVKSLIQDF